MSRPLFLVDAFSDGPFTGNPAGVCVLEGPAEDAWMQKVAMEMNQAETAFVYPEGERHRLRWFTPTTEVDLCGHATLASAHVLFQQGYRGDLIRFDSRSGELTATRRGEEIELDFPAEAPSFSELPTPISCLGSSIVWSGKNRMDWFVVLPSSDDVLAIRPDFAQIASLGMRGLIATAKDGSGAYDFVSRCFFPQSGVPEDPVTGSAHCALAAYWSRELGADELVGYQASLRGGVVKTAVRSNRIKLRGRAVTTLQGTFLA